MNSLLLCIPFAGLLLCIAVMPLVKPEWWEKHQALAVIVWSLLFIIPSIVLNGAGETTETVLECIVNDYLTFIVLLFGLFCVSGNITLEGNLAGSPAVNALFLAFGTLLSSCIGTTGASMLLVRPMIKMNSWRKNKAQIMIFFIFMISNMGGCLTPIGDPPLLMGFMRGVPFFWSLHLFPILIFNMILLLIIFYLIDKKQYRKDIANGLRPDISKPGVDIKVEGLHNIVFLVAIVVAVILSGTLPSLPMFQDAAGNVLGITIYKSVKLTFPAMIEIAIILLAALLSFKTTNEKIRTQNHFTWGAIQEVAILFIGIFITMQPALALLKTMGPNLGITEPYQMFWATYFNFEKGVYEQILAAKEPVSGTVKELAERFGLELLTMVGVLDGINDSLKTPNPIETMDENTVVSMDFDKELLYKNMVAAKAEWLYTLPQWDALLDADTRKALYKEQKLSTTVVNTQPKVGRNDPCPCGSGKKYKKCCGANA